MTAYTLIAFWCAWQIKHFVCDFPLQGNYMYGKFKPYPHFILPLLAHSVVHGVGTALLMLAFGLPWWVIPLDVATHFVIDRIKAHPKLGGRVAPTQKLFWFNLGLDQMAHHAVGACMLASLLVA